MIVIIEVWLSGSEPTIIRISTKLGVRKDPAASLLNYRRNYYYYYYHLRVPHAPKSMGQLVFCEDLSHRGRWRGGVYKKKPQEGFLPLFSLFIFLSLVWNLLLDSTMHRTLPIFQL